MQFPKGKVQLLSILFTICFALFGLSSVQAQLTITCPSDDFKPNDPSLCSAVITYTEPVGSGSGTGITTTLTAGLPSGSAFPVGTTVVTYTVTNNEGDSESCSFNVTVTDDEDPVFDCPADITVNADPGTCAAIVNFSPPLVTDNCGVNNVVQIGGLPSGSSFPVGENNIDFQASDDAGNLAFCRFKIIVEDITDPVIVCPANIIVEVFNSCDTIINYIAPVGSDACGPSTTTQTGGLGPGSLFPLGNTIEEYTVTDLAGNTATCQFTITLLDGAPPEITCPADITVSADPGTCEAQVNFTDPTATDNCPGSISITQIGGDPSGSQFPVGTSTIEYSATDAAGNTSTCSFTITVEEDVDPEITCPADITVSIDPGTCEAVVNYTPPVGTDNCPGAVTVLTSGLGPGATFPIGTTTETYTVTDVSGNQATCSFDIIVEDDEDPVITCPADITVSADPGVCEAVVNFADATATDNCPGVTVSQTGGPTSGSTFPVGTTVVEFTAEDAAGNTDVCTFNVIVEDDEDPMIACPADVVVSIPGGFCSTQVTYPDPVISDNCPGVSFTVVSGPASGDVISAGDYIVELQAIDAAGNTANCTFNISVSETSIPVFDCPADLVVPSDPGTCDAVVSFPDPTATDSCSTVTVTQTGGPVSGSTFPAGSTVVEFTAEDEYGNTATCMFNIIVQDDEDPVITCPADITVSADPGVCEAVVNFADATATDNCPGVTVSQTGGPTSGSTFPVGTTVVEFTAEDAAGNTDVCAFNVIVEDDEDPMITCPADVVVSIPGGFCSTQVTYPDPVISDNCPGVSFTVVSGPASGDVISAGDYIVELQAIDAAGNTANCTFNISVSETSIPVFDCPADLVVPSDPGTCDAVVSFPDPTATDSCSTVTVTQTGGPVSGSTFPAGSTAVEFTAEDEYGNTTTCTFNIIVEDDEDPVITCLADITVSADPGVCDAVVNFADATATDNCPGVTVSQTGGPTSGSTFPVGTTVVEFTAEDAAGNTDVCTFNVIVEDDEDPMITCPADVVVSIPGGFCSTQVTYPDPVISDNCPGVSFAVVSGPASGDVISAGDYIVELQAIDAAGNTANCTFNISVSETSIPVFDCPADLVVPSDPGTCDAVVSFPDPTATDSCSTVTVTQTGGPVSGSTFPAGSTAVEYTAEDEYGNTATCTFNILVQDDSPPTITCPDDILLDNEPGICGATVTYDPPVVDDNCGIAEVNQTGGLGSGSFFPVGTTIESYEVIDISGNISTCSFEITINDTELPTISCPADIDIVLADGDCSAIVNYSLPTVNDNCGIASLDLIEGQDPDTEFPTGTTLITYQVTDISGNTAECSFNVTLTENVVPTIDCPSDIVISNDPGQCGAVVDYTAPVGNDDCPGAITELIAGLGPGVLFPIGSTVETYQVTDASGNIATCSFTITVNDEEPASINCPDNIEVGNDAGLCSANVTYNLPTVSDNCDSGLIPVLTEGLPSGSDFPVGVTTVTYEVTDLSGNTSSCSFEVEVLDQEIPTITCPADIEIDAASGDCDVVVNYADPVVGDNCPGVGFTLIGGLPSGSLFPVGITTIEFEATDASGNTATCSFTVTVSEDVPPTITCPDDIDVFTDSGVCEAVVTYTEPIGDDNCGDATTVLIAGLPSGSSFPQGTTIVTYEVTDISGNTATCSFNVNVVDDEAPVFDCPDNFELPSDPSICGAEYNFELPNATDNCSANPAVTQTEGPSSGSLLPIGSTVFTFEATDEAGNVSVCSYTVTVVDDEAPVFTVCPTNSSVEVPDDSCEALVTFETPDASDNCSVTITQTEGPANNSVLAPGQYNFVFEAVDDAGNTSLCEFTLDVIDAIDPVIVCPESFETCDLEPTFDPATASDNCGVAQIVQVSGPESGSIFPIGESEIVFEATDVNGNTSTCSFVITVLETAPRADAGLDQNICDSTETFLNGSDPENSVGTWLLLEGSADIEEPNNPQTLVSNLGEGQNSFIWEVDPENGCDIETDTVNIFVESGVLVDAGEDQLIFNGGSVQINALVVPPDGDIEWQPPTDLSCTDCENPIASPDESTLYVIFYTTELGCEKSDSILISVFEELPNTITPDGDGVNDVWNIPEIENYPDVQVNIFNRWGNEVFASQGYNEPWDGTQNGKDLPTGSYYYVINYGVSGKDNLNGTVNIIR